MKSSQPHSHQTAYISVEDACLIVQRLGLAHCLAGMTRALEEDFKRWPEFDKTARVASHSARGVIELMPIADSHHYSFKYVNGHPGNTQAGLPTVMALGLLADVDTGLPVLLSELTLCTALRTAATSALAAQALARPDSQVMALIGNGSQAEFQALAFHHLLGIQEVRLFDVDPDARAKVMRNLADSGLHTVDCSSTAQAVQGADIVTTLTADKARAIILDTDLVQPGMHINAVGGDCPGKTELSKGVMQRASVFVEFEAQTRIEGELQQMPADFPVTELWHVLTAQAPGRTHRDQITVFDSVGFALEDFSALRFMRDCAQRLGLNRTLSLIPELNDPKDLFSLIRTHEEALSAT
jgi:ornithine cyclodeaminase